jgi:hypothetical protein
MTTASELSLKLHRNPRWLLSQRSHSLSLRVGPCGPPQLEKSSRPSRAMLDARLWDSLRIDRVNTLAAMHARVACRTELNQVLLGIVAGVAA